MAHGMVDAAIARLQGLRDGPAWQPMPDEIKSGFNGPPSATPAPLETVYGDVRNKLYPYATGNIHPASRPGTWGLVA
jgi:hypothetical protein